MLQNLKNLKTKTLIIISLSLTIAGIIFILCSGFIGSAAIRLVMVLILLFCIVNIRMTHTYLTTREKINYTIAVSASALGLFKPELTMFIIGAFLLFLTVPNCFNAIKAKDYSDIVQLVINVVGILFAAYCIINSKAALNTVIIIIGIILTVTGCLSIYYTFTTKKTNTSSEQPPNSKSFENTDNL